MKDSVTALQELKPREELNRNAWESLEYELQAARQRKTHQEAVVQEMASRLYQLQLRTQDCHQHNEEHNAEMVNQSKSSQL